MRQAAKFLADLGLPGFKSKVGQDIEGELHPSFKFKPMTNNTKVKNESIKNVQKKADVPMSGGQP